jgi:hypothetical protein
MKSVLSFVFLFVAIAFVVTTYPVSFASPVAEENKAVSPTMTNEEGAEESQQQEPEPEVQPEETTEEPIVTAEETNLPPQVEEDTIGPDNDCLFNPSLPKCASDNGECPEGFFQNEDGNCVPAHPNGCPQGYHSHEDDETGQCIPNDVACEPGYVLILENKPSCLREEFACQQQQDFSDADVCNNSNGNNDDDNDNDNDDRKDKGKRDKVIKIIKNIDIVNKINNVADGDDNDDDLNIEQTIVAINYQEGAGINCVFDDDDNGECETFDVTKDSDKDPLFQIIPFS